MPRSCLRILSLVLLVACISVTTAQVNDSCSSQPCLGGVCILLGLNDFICVCPMGARGKTCDQGTEVTTNSATMTRVESTISVGLSVTDGTSKATARDATVTSAAGTILATEQAGTSQTLPDLCSIAMSEICFNGGTCVLQCEEDDCGTGCKCLPGFEGLRCEEIVDSCSSSPCLANGDCFPFGTDFFCLCPVGFTGKTCNQAPTTIVPTDAETSQKPSSTTAMPGSTTSPTSGMTITTIGTTAITSDTTATTNGTTATRTENGTTALTSGTTVMTNVTTAAASDTSARANGTTMATGTTVMANGTTTIQSSTRVMTSGTTAANGTTATARDTTATTSSSTASSSVTVQTSNPSGGLQCFECNGVSQCAAENVPLRFCPEGQMCFSANITIGSDPATSLPLIRRGCENIPTGQRGCITSGDILAMRPDFVPIQVSIDETSGRACLCDSDACNININQEDTDILIVQVDTTGLSDDIVLTWNVLGIESNVDGFYVEIQVSGRDEWIPISPFLDTSERIFTITGVQNVNVSAIRVVAVDQSKREVSKSLTLPIRQVESGTKTQEEKERSFNVFGVVTAVGSSIVLISAMAAFWFKKRNNRNVQNRSSASQPTVNDI